VSVPGVNVTPRSTWPNPADLMIAKLSAGTVVAAAGQHRRRERQRDAPP
jgi:hypothetical protein